jgi:hypothetical protein
MIGPLVLEYFLIQGGVAAVDAPGLRLTQELTDKYDFDPQEMALLQLIAAQLNRIAELDATVGRDGLVIHGTQGERLHPAATESRQLSLSVARLIATLRLPLGDDEEAGSERLPQRRAAARGVYLAGAR